MFSVDFRFYILLYHHLLNTSFLFRLWKSGGYSKAELAVERVKAPYNLVDCWVYIWRINQET